MKRILIFTLFLFLIKAAPNLFGAEVPYLTGRVNDNARVLSDDTRNLLSEKLKEYELKTTDQIVILTVASLDGESIEDFANKVFNDWKLGQKDRDNGILIVVVPGERRMRIEVGYGLEGSLTDLQASRIIQNIMAPRFREGDYDGGITEGATAVINILEGNEVPETEGSDNMNNQDNQTGLSAFEEPDMPLRERILIGAFIFGIIGLFTLIGLFTPGFGWFLYLFLIPFWAMFPVVVLGSKGALVCFIIYLTGFPITKLILKNTKWYKQAKTDLRTKGKASIGGFTFTSGGSGGSWSSGGSSGGGFSGGGGSSGGGGASGSW